MCGIFGVLTHPDSQITSRQVRGLVKDLMLLSQSRGKEAAGIVLRSPADFAMMKDAVAAADFLRTPALGKLLSEFLPDNDQPLHQPLAVMGHSRMVTNGIQAHAENNQPVYKDGLVVIHNGIITNDQELWQNHRKLKRNFEVDTEVFNAFIAQNLHQGRTMGESLAEFFSIMEGAASIAMMFEDRDELVLSSNFGSLYLAVSEGAQTKAVSKHKYIVFASEKSFLERLGLDARLAPRGKKPGAPARIFQVRPGESYLIDLASLELSPCFAESAGNSSVGAKSSQPLPLRLPLAIKNIYRRCERCGASGGDPHYAPWTGELCRLCRIPVSEADFVGVENVSSWHARRATSAGFLVDGSLSSMARLQAAHAQGQFVGRVLVVDGGDHTAKAYQRIARVCGELKLPVEILRQAISPTERRGMVCSLRSFSQGSAAGYEKRPTAFVRLFEHRRQQSLAKAQTLANKMSLSQVFDYRHSLGASVAGTVSKEGEHCCDHSYGLSLINYAQKIIHQWSWSERTRSDQVRRQILSLSEGFKAMESDHSSQLQLVCDFALELGFNAVEFLTLLHRRQLQVFSSSNALGPTPELRRLG